MTSDDLTDAATKACIAWVAVGEVVGWMWWVETVNGAGRPPARSFE